MPKALQLQHPGPWHGHVVFASRLGEFNPEVCIPGPPAPPLPQSTGVISKGEDLPCPVDAAGRFTAEVTDFAGQYVKVRSGYQWVAGLHGAAG